MSYFIRNGNTFKVASEESLDIHQKLPVGNYTVAFSDMTGQFYLEMVDSFEPVKRLYGDTAKNTERILYTFNSRNVSTGVMLNGEKGSGKTLLAKTLSIEGAKIGMPSLIINHPWTGDTFNKFIQDIDQPAIILFDEFEKVYGNEQQEAALTLLDGVFSSKKLFILTCNDKWRVNEHMRNRPGRIFYLLEFGGLDIEFIKEYCQENLNRHEYIDKICAIANLFEKFNFDMLKALVEEMNRFDETPQQAIRMLNAKPEYGNANSFDVKLLIKGEELDPKRFSVQSRIRCNPLSDRIQIEIEDKQSTDADGDSGNWHYKDFTPVNIIRIEGAEGKFVYTNHEGDYLTLSRQKVEVADYFNKGLAF